MCLRVQVGLKLKGSPYKEFYFTCVTIGYELLNENTTKI
jgi:hypothetical protein